MMKIRGNAFAALLKRASFTVQDVDNVTQPRPSFTFDEKVDGYHMARKLTDKAIRDRKIRWNSQTKTFDVLVL